LLFQLLDSLSLGVCRLFAHQPVASFRMLPATVLASRLACFDFLFIGAKSTHPQENGND
jgi:hypothetical protein